MTPGLFASLSRGDEFWFFASGFTVLDGATPGSSDLTGFFDRFGFGPG